MKIKEEALYSRIKESQLFTNRFGSFSKADYEVLMFTVYLDSLDKPARDYEISRDLGITEQRVRNLRIKSQLVFPQEINWIQQMENALQSGTYDDGMVTITLEDPSVRNRIRYEVESKAGTVNLSLSSKQLVLPVESFLILAACAESDIDKVIEKLNEEFGKCDEIKDKIQKDKLGKRVLKGVGNIASVLETVLSVYSTGAPIIKDIIQMINPQ